MGKITRIEEGKRNKERVNIYIDDNFAFAMELELLYKMKLKEKMDINENEIAEIVERDTMNKCKERALKIVERSYKTTNEIKRKLEEKEFTEEAIEYAINFLIEYKFIDDMKYTRMYVKDKLYDKGKNKIKFELMRKGIEKEVIEEVFLEFDNDEELERGVILCEKKYNSLKKREDNQYKLKDKLLRYLVGRGYDFSISKEIINKVMKGEED